MTKLTTVLATTNPWARGVLPIAVFLLLITVANWVVKAWRSKEGREHGNRHKARSWALLSNGIACLAYSFVSLIFYRDPDSTVFAFVAGLICVLWFIGQATLAGFGLLVYSLVILPATVYQDPFTQRLLAGVGLLILFGGIGARWGWFGSQKSD